MNNYDTAIKSLLETHTAMDNEIRKLTREQKKVDHALKVLGYDPATRQRQAKPRNQPNKAERERREAALRRALPVLKPPFDGRDVATGLNEPENDRVYQHLLAKMAAAGEVQVVQIGVRGASWTQFGHTPKEATA